jgi:chromosome partitioning protein
MPRAVVTAIAMQKGGVGKTTCTICLARALCVYHQAKVLVVDFDPQGNTTSALAAAKLAEDAIRVGDAIIPNPKPADRVTMAEVIVPSIWDGVDLAPGGLTTAAAEKHIAAADHGREYRLREALAPVLDSYDAVLIDNAPALGLLLVNALTAADKALFVVEAEQWSADGLTLLRRTLDGVLRYHNPALDMVGTIINKWRHTGAQTDLADEMRKGMARHFPGVPFWMDRRIPLWTGIPDYMAQFSGSCHQPPSN